MSKHTDDPDQIDKRRFLRIAKSAFSYLDKLPLSVQIRRIRVIRVLLGQPLSQRFERRNRQRSQMNRIKIGNELGPIFLTSFQQGINYRTIGISNLKSIAPRKKNQPILMR